ncbi:MAG: family transcriptional regulator [Anaerosolibacter sp.]|uniref:helix-turn-helix domain-containing protein n=1 Tax=Anaerosolibacter sp. TaxID=1872527 RepID=UPI0026233277|nr:helix-turn-helix transcriptional regulator [Anaerosolibacter sp.]MDF2548783.1 family transcriptional regulator [Anaerosolibacter sp.]
MSIGHRIKWLRENRNIGQQELCDFLGVEQSTLANYENNRRTPKADMLTKIADYFNVTTDFLLGRTDKLDSEIVTIAAHHDGDWTEEELNEIEKFKEFVKMKRKSK